jgi:hypothetical protein
MDASTARGLRRLACAAACFWTLNVRAQNTSDQNLEADAVTGAGEIVPQNQAGRSGPAAPSPDALKAAIPPGLWTMGRQVATSLKNAFSPFFPDKPAPPAGEAPASDAAAPSATTGALVPPTAKETVPPPEPDEPPSAASRPAGRPVGTSPQPGTPAPPASDAPLAGREKKAADAARRLGEMLKSGAREDDGAAGAPSAPARPAAITEGSGDPARPRTREDLLLAASSGFKASFDAVGLKVSAGRVERRDGRPASDADLVELKRRIDSDPEALLRRPDFFEILPRARFSALKHDLSSRPDLGATVFRHVALSSSGRDLEWSQSCQLLSGSCNAAAERSYAKRDPVPPEDLRRIDVELHPEEEENRDEPRDEKLDAAIAAQAAQDAGARPDANILHGRVDAVIRGFQRFLDGDARAADESRGFESAAIPVPAPASAGAARAATAAPRDARTPEPPPSAAVGAPTPARTGALLLGAALAAFAALSLIRRRK